MKKIYKISFVSSFFILFFAINSITVFAVSENSLESDAVDTVFQSTSQSIIGQFPEGISGPITSIVSFLEAFRIQQYENALVKQATLEVEYIESIAILPVSDNTTIEIESTSYSDSISGISFDVVLYKMQYTGWSVIIALFKYWMLFYLFSIIVAVGLIGKLYGFFVRK